MENIIEQIKEFVEKESRKDSARYGYEVYKFHLIPVRNIAVELAKKLGADVEVVELAAWLHDIGSIIYGREDHHITGADIAERKLKELNYLPGKIKKVKACILNHRGSVSNGGLRNPEEKIISDADALSSFNNISGIFKAAFIYEDLTQGEARISAREKLERKWDKLYLLESKELIKPKYEAAMLLLS